MTSLASFPGPRPTSRHLLSCTAKASGRSQALAQLPVTCLTLLANQVMGSWAKQVMRSFVRAWELGYDELVVALMEHHNCNCMI